MAELTQRHVLDQPVFPGQYLVFLRQMVTLDLGEEFSRGQPAWSVIARYAPPTFFLVGTSMLLAAAIGVSFGIVGGWKRAGPARPRCHLLLEPRVPAGRRAHPGGDRAVLPDHPRVDGRRARRGLPHPGDREGTREREIRLRYAARNATLPVLTLLLFSFGAVLSGSIAVEYVFGYPGLGLLTVVALATRNFPILQGVFLLFATLMIGCNLVADIAYAWLDPRVRRD